MIGLRIYRHIRECKSLRPTETLKQAYKHYRWVHTLKPGNIVMAPGPESSILSS
jgi:hypothetical protein